MGKNLIILLIYVLFNSIFYKSCIVFANSIPKVSIITDQSIGEDYISADFFLIENSDTTVQEKINIRIRGGNSRTYPKKSFRIEFRTNTETDTTKNVQLLNMRSDDDWNLNAMYNEPLRINTKTAFELWDQIYQSNFTLPSNGKNGIDIEYVQVYINQKYEGIYILTERIDQKQLKLSDESGELYKTFDHSNAALFKEAIPYNNQENIWDGIEWKHPDDQIDWGNLYDLVHFVTTSSTYDFLLNYSHFIDIHNFVDYYIFLNLLSLHDNTGKNIYIGRLDSESPYFYIPWDLDGSFGFAWDGTFSVGTKNILSNGLYDRLIKDCYANGFVELLKTRWEFLRSDIIDTTNIYALMDRNQKQLAENNIYQLERNRWNTYLFSSTLYKNSKSWVQQRIQFLDQYMENLCDVSTSTEYSFNQNLASYIYPNPTKDIFNIRLKPSFQEDYLIQIFHLNGQKIWEEMTNVSTSISTHHWPKGMYVIQIRQGNQVQLEKLVVQ